MTAPPVPVRLAAWADRTLLPGLLVVLLTADLLVAGNWMLSPASSLTSPAYDTAKLALPMPVWGALFAVAGSASAVIASRQPRGLLTGYFVGALCGGLWALWTVLFTLAPLGRPGASFFGAIAAVALTALHLLTGLALTHRAGPPGG